MAELWMPGAERRAEGNGGSMVGGPPRAVWHITWDSLGPGGKQPAFDSIANYLQNVNYCPHLMWDPWTGKIVQFYPANQSARALSHPAGTVETNRMGSVCIQVEVFFSPGAVRDGKKYMTVADTPCKGLDKIVAWMRSWGVEDAWPSGWPQWSGNSRSVSNWQNKSGHYGHCHVPGNDHTDPGPMPKGMFSGQAEEEEDMPDYVSVGMTEEQQLPPNQWVTVNWGKEFADSSHHHWNQGGPSFIIGPARYTATCNVRITGLAPGTELQARIIENPEDKGEIEYGPTAEYVASEGATFVHYNVAAAYVSSGYRARFQVIQYGTETGVITKGDAKGLAWS